MFYKVQASDISEPCQISEFELATSLKKRLWHSCFPVNFGNFPTTAFVQIQSLRGVLQRFCKTHNESAVLEFFSIQLQATVNLHLY